MPVRIAWSQELHASITALSADAKGALTRRWLERALFELAPEAFRASGLVDEAKRFATLDCSLAAAPETVRVLEELRDCVQKSPLWEQRSNPGCSSLRAARQCARWLAVRFEQLVSGRSASMKPTSSSADFGDPANGAASLLMQIALWVDVAHVNLPDDKMSSAPVAQAELDRVRAEIAAAR